jgi:transcriptional regulator with XRE-family HTH domain
VRKRTIYSREYGILLSMLRQARDDHGLTQGGVAKRLKMSQSIFSKYERGELRLDVIQLRDWCNALGISFAKFTRELDRRAGK